jgi:uncharacterized Zn-binding protein involved in type VI secretion
VPTVFANGRSILHAGDGLQHVSTLPDVCKTPSPGGPVPVPYVNVAATADLAKGTKRVKIGGKSVALASSHLSTSVGDEPGTAGGGLASSKTKGKMTWGSASADVKFEGKGVVRFGDVTQHNGNSFNAAFVAAGGTGFAYGDDSPCFICGKPYENHRVHETPEIKGRAKDFMVELNERMIAQQRAVLRAIELNNELRRGVHERKQLKGGKHREAREALDLRMVAARAERDAINASLASIHVLRFDDQSHSRTYSLGFMMGRLKCKCGAKEFVAMSGGPSPGFRAAAAESGAELVGGPPKFERGVPVLNGSGPMGEVDRARYMVRHEEVVEAGKWECAAPQLVQACHATGHKPGVMTEMFFGPIQVQEHRVPGVGVDYERDGVPISQRFGHGETVPSCSRCQILLPPMLCDTEDSECPK